MQLNTNSNAAILQEIRAQPTLAGQYRKAFINRRDRQIALDEYAIERERLVLIRLKAEQRIEMLQKEAQEAETETEAKTEQVDLTGIDILIREAELNIAEAENGIATNDELVQDAMRELSVYQAEMDRCNAEFGRDFAALTTNEFQELMAQEHEARMIRYIAAAAIAPMMGLPEHVAEQILELPSDTRIRYMERAIALMNTVPVPTFPFPEKMVEASE